MTTIDRMLQRWRIRVAQRHLAKGDRVLDVGCADGALFHQCLPFREGSLGLDPNLGKPIKVNGHACLPGRFPDDVPPGAVSEVVCLLAVVEHIPSGERERFREGLREHLLPGGRVVVTVPSPAVDRILWGLKRLDLVHGMALEEHHGFEPKDIYRLFAPPHFRLVVHRRFQLGLNHVFVFIREA